MGKALTSDDFRALGLMAFQAEFAAGFCANGSHAYWELIAPVGTGKTHLARVLVDKQFESGAERVLVLTAKAILAEQWRHGLSSQGDARETIVMDRRTFLELEASAPQGNVPWPVPSIIVMSTDLAKRPDVEAELVRVAWDLVVADESHLLTGKKRELVERLLNNGLTKRALLLTSNPTGPLPGVERQVWNLEDLVDWDGHPLRSVVTRRVKTLEYRRTPEEQNFVASVAEFSQQLAKTTNVGRLQSSVLVRAASSSYFAGETVLRRLIQSWRAIRNRLIHGMPPTAGEFEESKSLLETAIDESGPVDFPDRLTAGGDEFLRLFLELERLLSAAEELSADTKLEAVSGYVAQRFENTRPLHLCIWTSFLATVDYLSSALEGVRVPVYVLTGSVDWAARENRVKEYQRSGGILIVTDVAADEKSGGAALGYVDECINYDLPVSPAAMENRWGRFLRISREKDFEMIFLRDLSKSFSWDETLFDLVDKWAGISDDLRGSP